MILLALPRTCTCESAPDHAPFRRDPATVGYPVLDSIAGSVVAVAVTYSGYEILTENVGYILARAPDEDFRGEITDSAMSHDEVHGIHDVCIYHGGPEIDVSMHLEVEGDMRIERAHDIEIRVADYAHDRDWRQGGRRTNHD